MNPQNKIGTAFYLARAAAPTSRKVREKWGTPSFLFGTRYALRLRGGAPGPPGAKAPRLNTSFRGHKWPLFHGRRNETHPSKTAKGGPPPMEHPNICGEAGVLLMGLLPAPSRSAQAKRIRQRDLRYFQLSRMREFQDKVALFPALSSSPYRYLLAQ